MNKQNRKLVNKEQINRFFFSYYSEWRHIQIYGIKKKLDSKYEFYNDIIDEIRHTDKSVGEKTISQEITNGLLFEAIQHSLQYIEDLFALLNASKNQDYFIRSIVQYSAGKIGSSIKNYKFTRENICKDFHFPNYPKEESQNDAYKAINESIARFEEILKTVIEHYKKFYFFYNQYKHGLSIALRPYRNYSEEEVEDDKKNKFEQPPIIALDSLAFEAAKKNQYGNTGYLLIPGFSDNIRIHAKELQNENNLMRFVLSPEGTNIDMVLEIAKKTKRCMQIFIHNFLEVINDKNPMMLRLPAPIDSEVYEFEVALSKQTKP